MVGFFWLESQGLGHVLDDRSITIHKLVPKISANQGKTKEQSSRAIHKSRHGCAVKPIQQIFMANLKESASRFGPLSLGQSFPSFVSSLFPFVFIVGGNLNQATSIIYIARFSAIAYFSIFRGYIRLYFLFLVLD